MSNTKNIFRESAHLGTGQMLNYLRHQLTLEEVRQVEHHLSDCELCSDALDGLRKLNADSGLLSITEELQKMARKRKGSRRKIFSQLDLISLFAIVFLVIFLIVIAVVFFWKR